MLEKDSLELIIQINIRLKAGNSEGNSATTADELLAKAGVVTVPLAPTASQRIRYEGSHLAYVVQQHHMVGTGGPLEGQFSN